MPRDALLPRFPGSKRTYLSGWYDAGDYDAAIAPFMGSARWECFWADKVKALFSADADRSIQAAWQCWMNELSHETVYSLINSWISGFSNAVTPEFVNEYKAIQIKYAGKLTKAQKQAKKAELKAFTQKHEPAVDVAGWKALESAHNITAASLIDLASTTLVLRQLTFGGVVRCSSNGSLNVKWEAGQLAKLPHWSYEFPPVPRIPFRFEHDYLKCIKAFERSNYQSAIALLDPPYYANRATSVTYMSAAYPGHRPHAPETLAFFTNSVEGLAATKRVSRMIITGYFEPEIDEALFAVAKAHSLPFERKLGRTLDGINQSREHRTKRVECEWELGVRASNQLALAI